jgi:hypothetical protein
MDTRELAFLLARLQPPRSVVADPAEVLALRVVVGVLIGLFAKRSESNGEPAQSFINDLAAICQQALVSAQIVVEEGHNSEKVRRNNPRAAQAQGRCVASPALDSVQRGSLVRYGQRGHWPIYSHDCDLNRRRGL